MFHKIIWYILIIYDDKEVKICHEYVMMCVKQWTTDHNTGQTKKTKQIL